MQLVDLNWAILQEKTSADIEVSEITEARYHRAAHKIKTHAHELNSAQKIANTLYPDVQSVMDGIPKKECEGSAHPFDLEFIEFGLQQIDKLFVEVGRERRLYRRYVGEAWAQRKKALREWCALSQDETLNLRNKLNRIGYVDILGR